MKKIYVFKSEYKSEITEPGMVGSNVLTLVATFEAGAETEARRFASMSLGGHFYIWTNGGINVEETK